MRSLFIQNVLNDRRKQKEDGYYNRAMHKKGFGKDIDYLVCAIVEVPEVVVEKNLMNEDSLARVFAPTIIGYSKSSTLGTAQLGENPKIIHCMFIMLHMQEAFWQNILENAKFPNINF